MNGSAMWESLVARWPWSATSECEEQDEDATHPERERHQRRLNRLLARGLPIWTEEPLSCDECGRRLLTGERASILKRGDELLLSCSLCEERLLDEGCFHVRPDLEKETSPDDGHSLAA